MVRIWVASLHQKSSSVFSALEFFVLLARETHKCGWIRTAAALSQKTAQKQPSGLFLAARLAQSTRAHQKTSTYTSTLRFLFCNKARLIERVDSNSNSDDRCQRQKQGGAVGAAASRMRVPPKARCSRWEPRPGLLIQRGLRNPPAPTKNSSIRTGYWSFCLPASQKGRSSNP